MPMKKIREIRDLSNEDRSKRLSELKTELVRMRTMVKAGGAVENPSRIRELKKAIARIQTVMVEKTEGSKQK
jgi:large subunit ribosomal protein L29